MDIDTVRRYQLYKQQLDGDYRERGLLALVRRLLALHSTDYLTPYLSLFARLPEFSKADLYAVLNERRSLIRINAMRTTVFVIPVELYPMIFMATRRQIRRFAAMLAKEIPVSGDALTELREKAIVALSLESLTTGQLKRALGIDSNILWLLRDLMAEGLVVRAEATSMTGTVNRYTHVQRWLPGIKLDSLSPTEANDRLLLEYINLFGPVCTNDMAWWSGLGKMEVSASIVRLGKQDALRLVDFSRSSYEEDEYYMTTAGVAEYEAYTPGSADVVSFLPYEDHYAKGYIERSWYLSRDFERTIISSSGEARPTIWLNGAIIGWWEAKRTGTTYRITYELLQPVSSSVHDQIEERIQAVARFLNEK